MFKNRYNGKLSTWKNSNVLHFPHLQCGQNLKTFTDHVTEESKFVTCDKDSQKVYRHNPQHSE